MTQMWRVIIMVNFDASDKYVTTVITGSWLKNQERQLRIG